MRRLMMCGAIVVVLLVAGGVLACWLADRYITRIYVHRLAAEGDTEGITVLLRFFPEKVNAQDDDGLTPLLHAAEAGHTNTVRNLLAAGANTDYQLPLGPTALHTAVAAGDQAMVKSLLDSDADVGRLDASGRAPLILALKHKNIEIAKMLLDAGANINQPVKGDPPLHHLTGMGYPGGVALILKLGADVNGKDTAGKTALDLALAAENRELTELLRSRDGLTAERFERVAGLETVYQNWLKSKAPPSAEETEAIIAEIGHHEGRRRRAAMEVVTALQLPALETLVPSLESSKDPEIRLASKDAAASLQMLRASRIAMLSDEARKLDRERKYQEAGAAYIRLAETSGKKEDYDRALRALARDRRNMDPYYDALGKYLKKHPEESKRFAYTLYMRAVRAKDYATAVRLARDMYKAQPTTTSGKYVWDSLIAADRREEAAEHYLAMAKNPKMGKEDYRLSLRISAASVLAEKKPETTLKLLTEILQTPKLSIDVRRRAVYALINHLRKTDGLDAYLKSAISEAEANPKDLARTELVADLYSAQRGSAEVYKARAEWRVKAYRLQPTEKTLFGEALNALRASKQYPACVELLKDYYKQNPEREGAEINLHIPVLNEAEEHDLVFKWIESYRKHKSSKKGPLPDYLLAQQHQRLKQFDKAIPLYEKMLTGTHSGYAQTAAEQLALIYREQKKPQDALAALEKGVKLEKVHPTRAWRMLTTMAAIHLEQEDADKAMAIYKRALEDKTLAGVRFDIIVRIQNLYLQQEQREEALAFVKKQKGTLKRSHEKRRLLSMIAKLSKPPKVAKKPVAKKPPPKKLPLKPVKPKPTVAAEKRFKGHEDVVRCVAFSPDGKRAFSAGNDSTLRAWDLTTDKQLFSIEAHKGAVCDLVVTETKVITGGDDGAIRLWNVKDGSKLGQLEGHTKGVWALSLSSDKKLLASAGMDGKAKLWDLATERLVREFKGHSRGIRGIAISPTGDRLATGGLGRDIIVWDLKTGKQLKRFRAHRFAIRTVAFSADGKTLFSGSDDMSIGIWDAATGKLQRRLTGHVSVVTETVATPDKKHLLSAGLDSVVMIWDLATGKPVRKLENHTGGISGVALEPSGKRILTANRDRTVCLLPLPAD